MTYRFLFGVFVIQMLSFTAISQVDPEFDWEKNNKARMCKKDIGSDDFSFNEDTYPKNKEYLFDMCEEQAANTCCAINDLNRIIARLKYIKRQDEFPVSEECMQ